jgi:protocatechuate 3,4-dioxygenase beta subunit
MDSDDRPIGRVLGRRELLKVLGAGGAAMAAGLGFALVDPRKSVLAAVPGCAVRPELTVGPYFLDQQLKRSDIRVEPSTGALSAGVPLALAFNVSQIASGGCTALPGAIVDVWQCDAKGTYSGVSDGRMGFDTLGQKFLRGYQVTDDSGRAEFRTIYPGWYPGRAVHIHFKIRTTGAPAGAYEFTSQLFFDDTLTDRVHADPVYGDNSRRRVMNASDGIYQEAGATLILAPTTTSDGMAASFDIALDLSDAATGRPDGMERPGRGRGGRGGPDEEPSLA